MKATAYYRPHYGHRRPLPFPNAATRRQVIGKLLDLLLIAVSGAGIASAVMLLLVLI